MTSETDFPQWICGEYQDIQSQVTPGVGDRMDTCRKEFQKLSQTLDKFPTEIEIYEILTASPKELMSDFPHAFGALAHLCEYWVGSWYFRHVCKVRGYLLGLKTAMEDGNWLVACTCTRSILEEVVHFDLFLRRIEERFKKIIQLVNNEAKRINKGIEPPENWHKQYIDCHLEIVMAAAKAIQGTNYDWGSYLDDIADDLGVSRVELDMDMNCTDSRTHILKCIEKSQSNHDLPFNKHYDDLSERCHPNFGSNMLVISKREKKSEKYGTVWFSDRVRNCDGACFFFEIACEPIISTFSVGTANIVKVMNIHSIFTKMAEESSSPINNLLARIND